MAKLKNEEPLILKRNEAYIGVLIDDLVTKGTHEPYRLLTSRAEFRLILRHDNADLRLRHYGYQKGLINEREYQSLLNKEKDIEELLDLLKKKRLKSYFFENTEIKGHSLFELIKRPKIRILDLIDNIEKKYNNDVLEQVETKIKYEGYINKTIKEAEKLLKLESKQIPEDIDYIKIKNLASEARQKLSIVRPKTIGQATRISGVNPVDISILTIYLKKEYNK